MFMRFLCLIPVLYEGTVSSRRKLGVAANESITALAYRPLHALTACGGETLDRVWWGNETLVAGSLCCDEDLCTLTQHSPTVSSHYHKPPSRGRRQPHRSTAPRPA